MSSDKPDLARAGTMQVTAKEAEALLGEDRPDPDAGTRGQQKKIDEINAPPPAKKAKKGANALKPASTIQKTLEEAKALYGDIDTSSGRSMRKRPEKVEKPKPALKKAGTMQNTAKEGKAYLKRQKKGAASKKKEEAVVEEANGASEEAEATASE